LEKNIETEVVDAFSLITGYVVYGQTAIATLPISRTNQIRVAAEIEVRLNLPCGSMDLSKFVLVGEMINRAADIRNA
jgi:hypothetical protein